MSDQYPEMKVTIILETGDRKQTITLPKSHEVKMITDAQPDVLNFEPNSMYVQSEVRFQLNLTAIFDVETGSLYSIETSGREA